ncbi:MAG: VWA domain-containing protein, partial [Gammaproteobacteria bacterium]|nr:VWA domain-containing protein [Gammaproteobacteria bacterium]
MREGAPRSTVAIIISDGYDQGDVEEVRREMTALRRRVRSVVWINPMYGSMSYQPTAKGMQAALPFVD